MNEQTIRREEEQLETRPAGTQKATNKWEEAKTEEVALFSSIPLED
ncbi:MAG: hypothetical protein WA130_11110 [Candidatus Methanoperedens sp.]